MYMEIHSPVHTLHSHPYAGGETLEGHYHTASVMMVIHSEINIALITNIAHLLAPVLVVLACLQIISPSFHHVILPYKHIRFPHELPTEFCI
jgi:hypothetical protein